MQNILDFEKDYKEAKVVLLEENYRSTKTILQAANDVIKTIATAVRRISGHKMKTGKKLSITGLMTSRMKQSLLLKRLKSLVAKLATSTVILPFSTGLMPSHGPLKKPYSVQHSLHHGRGTKFYSRKEIRDVIAYLNLIANLSDNISFERIINEPKRGIGPGTVDKIRDFAPNARVLTPWMLQSISCSQASKERLPKPSGTLPISFLI